MATPSAPSYEEVNSNSSEGAGKSNDQPDVTSDENKDDDEFKKDFFECNICLDVAKEPVVR